MRCGVGRNERGAITVWVTAALLGFILAVGLGVDFAGHARAQQEARAVAAEAARAGGQQLSLTDGRLIPEVGSAVRAAQTYVAASRFSGAVRVHDGEIEVTVTGQYSCLFLSMIGVRTLPVEAVGTAELTTSR
ncbi:MAG: pilus assembly protein TadG-related protein [Propionibacteriaceae bacterium]|nr:pilus assembly protein TadG-related protein [Propionibacteriaceae bacterium]